jgi:hypothetical protein
MLIDTLRCNNELDRHVQNQRVHIFGRDATWRKLWPMNTLPTTQRLRNQLPRLLVGRRLHILGFNCAS